MTKWYPTTHTVNYNKSKLMINMQDIFFPTSHLVAMSLLSLHPVHGSAGPRSYYIKTDTGQIRRNRVQVQLAPPLNNVEPLPEFLKSLHVVAEWFANLPATLTDN
ncbi:hypothetical protein P5673_022425 [Acropora cervicornis]|uniref:Uncharacterized protein n=1 Tax=Acropora cervicornis TaxID=6130 RepID=A0AAD9UZS3_ACRCE|nr:hypothetical protein P5673_022425 [Acropora cervicornis]